MSYPGPIIPEVFGTQDKKDDDGQVIDSLLIETDAPPDLKTATQLVDAPETPKIPRPSRLLTGNITLVSTLVSPVMILPADTNRKSVTLSVLSTAASPNALVEYVSVADNNGVLNTTSAWNLRNAAIPVTLYDYTGALWVFPATTITAAIELTWVAVTL